MREVGDRHDEFFDLSPEFSQLLMRSPQEFIQNSELVHEF